MDIVPVVCLHFGNQVLIYDFRYAVLIQRIEQNLFEFKRRSDQDGIN